MCRTVETETKAAREKGLRLRGVFHAFAEDADTYRQLKECGDFLFGIGGVVTFKRAGWPIPYAKWSSTTWCSKPTVPT